MRTEMKELYEKRMKFTAVFKRFGSKINWHGYPEETILLTNVTDMNENQITDHIWFSYTKGFQKIGELKEGDKIEFFARVRNYVKGYVRHSDYIDNRTIDYKLNNPTKIRRIEYGNQKVIPLQTISEQGN